MATTSYAGKVNAPDFPPGLDWFNTDRPISLRDLRGRIVLLDFWTYCCINCMHVVPDLKRLEAKYPDELVVIGVHSAKFGAERESAGIREAILRYGIGHPVVNDRDFTIWDGYAVRAWPSFMLIDPDGKVVATHSGENAYEIFDGVIAGMIEEFDAKGKLLRGAPAGMPEAPLADDRLLAFPGKLALDPGGHTLYIADSNHNRIVIVALASGVIVDVIGEGGEGLSDGGYRSAHFNRPQGVALDDNILYVADTGNHAIRRVDLRGRTVSTIAGTGEQAREFNVPGRGRDVALNSPWDLAVRDGIIYIAMAGSHQIWRLDPDTLDACPYAGSGREELIDGSLRSAALAQPSGLAVGGEWLYVADSEVSAIRAVDLDPAGEVRTIVGEGLFEFGDADGVGEEVRLQHPLGIAHHDGLLYIADSYNNRIKVLDPATRRAVALVGSGERGFDDGDAAGARLNEPSGLDWGNGLLYIADTNNHAVRVFDPSFGTLSTLPIRAASEAPSLTASPVDAGSPPALAEAAVAPGEGAIELLVRLPEGHELNHEAPLRYSVSSSCPDMVTVEGGMGTIESTGLPIRIPARFIAGRALVRIDMTIYHCQGGDAGLCLIAEPRVILPVRVSADAAASVVEAVVAVE